MTWYRMSGSSKGELHGASILVTVDGEITSGDTVTLSATGYSQTKTLSDVKTALFTDLLDSGTYTATYKTFSKTVSVSAQDVLDKTTKNVTVATSTTITLTIEGAKEDNIKIYDSANTQVGSCVFASGQTTGTVELEIPATGGTYKFESTVAKDTTTGTSNYSKNVSLTNSTTSVKCMPEGALYWYGNECEDKTGGILYGVWLSRQHGTFDKQTNKITLVGDRAFGDQAFYLNKMVDITGYSKFKCQSLLSSPPINQFRLCLGDSVNAECTTETNIVVNNGDQSGDLYNNKEVDISSYNGEYAIRIQLSMLLANSIFDVYAFWLE